MQDTKGALRDIHIGPIHTNQYKLAAVICSVLSLVSFLAPFFIWGAIGKLNIFGSFNSIVCVLIYLFFFALSWFLKLSVGIALQEEDKATGKYIPPVIYK
ncbi:MAG: hypothetical protein IKE43_07785 [Coriobacteriales bacterium]|nr:hypothetical protein [Coriobacteriales bacterium]